MTPLQRIVKAYAEMSLISNAKAAELKHVMVTGAGDNDRSQAPPGAFSRMADRGVGERWEKYLECVARVMERELHVARHGEEQRPASTDSKSPVRKEQLNRILHDWEGLSPFDIGFIERRDTQGIRRLRGRAGRDPETGYPVSHTGMMTAKGRDQYAAYRDSQSDEQTDSLGGALR